MNRRTFLQTLTAVIVAPLVMPNAPVAVLTEDGWSVNGRPAFEVGDIIEIDGHDGILRVVSVSGTDVRLHPWGLA